jgi:putrescine transport system ATP-binding protein
MVTHDQEEAMTMSSRLAVMDVGRILQVGTPSEIYEYPGNRFIAGFIGAVNLFEGRVVSCEEELLVIQSDDAPGEIVMYHTNPLAVGTPDTVALRPEKIRVLDAPPRDDRNWVQGTVREIGYLGDVSIYHVGTRQNRTVQVQVTNRAQRTAGPLTWDDSVYLGWDNDAGVVLTA